MYIKVNIYIYIYGTIGFVALIVYGTWWALEDGHDIKIFLCCLFDTYAMFINHDVSLNQTDVRTQQELTTLKLQDEKMQVDLHWTNAMARKSCSYFKDFEQYQRAGLKS